MAVQHTSAVPADRSDHADVRPAPGAGSRLDPVRGVVRRALAQHGRLRDPRAVRRRSRPEVVSLAGGMPNLSALPLDAVADTSAGSSPSAARRRCSTAPGRVTRPCASRWRRCMPLVGRARAPGRRRGHRRFAAGAGPGDPGAVRPGGRGAGRGALVRRGAVGSSRRTSADVVHVAMDAHGLVPEALREALARVRPQASGSSSSTPIPNFHNPAGVTLAAERRAGDPGDLPRGTPCWCSRTTRTGCSASTASRAAALRADDADGVIYLGLVLQDVRPRLPGRLGAGTARRPREARARRRRRRRCARRRSARWPSRRTSPSTTGWARSRSSGRCTASAATRCSTRCDDMLPAGATWTVPDRRLLLVGHAARRPRREGDAAARGDGAGRVRARHRVLRRRRRGAGACGCRTATRPGPDP